jgi:hypothetical protein
MITNNELTAFEMRLDALGISNNELIAIYTAIKEIPYDKCPKAETLLKEISDKGTFQEMMELINAYRGL